MAESPLLEDLLRHLSRIRCTTFLQYVDYLVATESTPEKSGVNSGERHKRVKKALAPAIDAAKAAGHLVERLGVFARGKKPRAELLFDSGRDPELTPAHHARLYERWRRHGRLEIPLIYSPESIRFYRRAIADLGPDPVTAELVVSSIYFQLPAEQMEGWRPIDDLDGLYPSGNSICSDGSPAVRSLAGAVLVPTGTAILVPVVNCEFKTERRPEHEAEFVEYFRWVMGLRAEIADDPQLQIWMPDPESILS